jgi:hypothetical protein
VYSVLDDLTRLALRDLTGDGRLDLLILDPRGLALRPLDADGRYDEHDERRIDWPSHTVGWNLADLDLVLGSPYGLMLVRKVVVVAVIAALGAYHWRVVQPSVGSDRSVVALRRSIAVDAAFVLLVLVLTAILTGTAPPVRSALIERL